MISSSIMTRLWRYGLCVLWVLPCVGTACTRAGFAVAVGGPGRAEAGPRDGGGELADLHDARAEQGAATGCDWSRPFTFNTPEPIAELNSADLEGNPFLSPDGLTIYFNSSPAGGGAGHDIYVAQRSSDAGLFTNPQPLAGVNSSSAETSAELSADGLTIFLAAQGAASADILIGTRPSTIASFDRQAMVTPLLSSTTEHEYDPSPSPDGLRLYFVRFSADYSTGNLYLAERSSPGASFGDPVPLAEINSPGEKSSMPSISADERVLLYTRNVGAEPTNIHYAIRAARNDAFTPMGPVPVINSTDSDGGPHLSPDRCTLYFFSNRPGAGSNDLYRATFVPL